MKRIKYTYNMVDKAGYMDFPINATLDDITLKIGINAIILEVRII